MKKQEANNLLRLLTFDVLAVVLLLAVILFVSCEAAHASDYIIESVQRLDATKTTHTYCPPIVGPVPTQGIPFYDIASGYPITRISDVLLAGGYPTYPKGWNGKINCGLHNGYSHYSCANRTGEYLLSFGTNPLTILIRLSDFAHLGLVRAKSGLIIGDQAEPRWSRNNWEPPTTLYYHIDAVLYKQDVLLGRSSERLVYDFGSRIIQTDDNEISNDGRYGAYRLANGYSVVFDFFNQHVLPGRVLAATPGLDISPDGKWFQVLNPNKPGRYYRITDLENGDTSHAVIRSDLGGHGGWGYDPSGNCVSVYQCNADDWIKAFNPETGEKIKIIYMREMASDTKINQHMARMSNVGKKGWLLMSTYASTDTTWARNQLFMLEIKPTVRADGSSVPLTERPRIWRLGHTQGNYSGSYFTEAFASIDMVGQNIYWGTNWRGQDNIELYRMALPTRWHDVLDGIKVIDPPNIQTLSVPFTASWHNFTDPAIKLRLSRDQDGKIWNWDGAKFTQLAAPKSILNTGTCTLTISKVVTGPTYDYHLQLAGADGRWLKSDRFGIR